MNVNCLSEESTDFQRKSSLHRVYSFAHEESSEISFSFTLHENRDSSKEERARKVRMTVFKR